MTFPVTFVLNGETVSTEVEARSKLVDCLRHRLGRTGTHVGCEHGVCGACTVTIDGEAVLSCLTLAVQVEGRSVMTVEGLAKTSGELSPLQLAFRKHHGLQCGFCTPGMLMAAHALLTNEPDASKDRIREAMSGNICRCTGYLSIIDSVEEAGASYRITDRRIDGAHPSVEEVDAK